MTGWLKMPEPRMMAVNGVDLAVWEWPGAEPAVLLCHATGFHGRCWDQVVRRLPGRRVLAVDLRGHGHSTKPAPPYTWRAFGEDVAAVVDALGLESAVGVGHSMGGHSVTLAAALRPEAFGRLLLLDPVIFPPEAYAGARAGEHYTARRRNRWASAEEMFERFENRPPFASWDRAVLRDYCGYGLLPAADGDGFELACPPAVEASIYANSTAGDADIGEEIARIEIPVRVVRSARPVTPNALDMGASPTPRGLAARFRLGKDAHVDAYGHLFPMEAPGLVAEMIG
ncbi:MAG: alpha/beta hydrolase [Bryobacteraceae bacterium]